MRPIQTLLLAAALLLSPAARALPDAGLDTLHISLIEGDVQLRIPEADDWVAAAINTPLRAGDRLWLPGGARLELRLRDGSRVRLNEYSALEILRLDPDAAQFYLSRGQAFVNFRGRARHLLQFDTPPAALRATDRAVFRVDVRESGETDLGVLTGLVRADSRRERRSAGPGERLVLREDGSVYRMALGPADEWERWNHARDRVLSAGGASARYLPEELDPYADDFDQYGRWVSVPDYGWVWTPQVFVSVGWAPYSYGRWVWIGGDYIWISYDPWGWVPHHYGRWVFSIGIGWCWVPPRRGAVYWAPGWVGWEHSHPHVAWVPLAPGEIYYGYGHYGPHSVDLRRTDLRKFAIRPDYRNARVAGGVIAVSSDNFLRGRLGEARLAINPFQRAEIQPGRPAPAPASTGFALRAREIPASARPPEAVRKVEIPRLREDRPLVREPSRPVFRGVPAPAPTRRMEPAATESRPSAARPATPRAPEIQRPTERRTEPAPREIRRPVGPTERRPEPTAPARQAPAIPERQGGVREIERRSEPRGADGGSSRVREAAPRVDAPRSASPRQPVNAPSAPSGNRGTTAAPRESTRPQPSPESPDDRMGPRFFPGPHR